MNTVLVTEFSVDGTKLNWAHDCGHTAHAENVNVSSFSYAIAMGGGTDKTLIVIECSVCHTQSFYPMSGGTIAQGLHKHYLEQKTLGNVQTDATERGIATGGKTQAQLIVAIIQDECIKKDVPYLL